MIGRRLTRAALSGFIGLIAACAAPARSADPGQGATPGPQGASEAWSFPTQNRPDVSGRQGAVVSDHPLAVAAGYEVLARGGNAFDAAVTMAAVLAVVRPHMNGLGGDAFGLFHEAGSGRVTALNASGRSGALATPEFFSERGMSAVPGSGAATITVPGALAGWVAVLERYGSITLAEALAPAIRHAEEGWVVTSTLQRDIGNSVRNLNAPGRAIFAPGGAFPPTGALLSNPALAQTLRAIADEGPGVFYGGRIGETLARFVAAEGGYLTPADFRANTADWTDPISVVVGPHRLYAFAPNSQGVAQLQQLAMAQHHPLADMGHNSPEYLHALIELKKLSFADRDRWVADPDFAPAPLDRLLAADYLQGRAAQVGVQAAESVAPGFGGALATEQREGDGDTVYLMVVDGEGNAVSWIQSLFSSLGSRLVEPETGIVLHNRGSGFTLEPGHPNRVEPGKRPFHTLSPMMVTDTAGRLILTIGTPGGHGQPQFLTQVYLNLFAFGMSPQQAVEAPRFISNNGRSVQLESLVGPATLAGLRARGHSVQAMNGWTATLGGVQLILVDPDTDVLRTGADPRREAYAIAY